ncbi:hypothetical protein LOK49_LG01G03488 [Camellia lanceoleosa]|uniref:Uncharacterized protein n=1 Tax=Camellia lanceoleosa TaxID=1840588 RepID=A0ACC0IXW8_9ERIC|nr:hypothetical protein LOK49_LG01G03488 [Camellia lanceoleosa]
MEMNKIRDELNEKISEVRRLQIELTRRENAETDDIADGLKRVIATLEKENNNLKSDKINLDIQRVVGYRQWCNKLWNAVRFAMSKLGDNYTPPTNVVPDIMPFNCQWILSVLNKAISKTVTSLDSYEFSDAATAVYSWWQFQLCDVFIEAVKPYFASDAQAFASERSYAQDTLWVCLDNGLRLLHPFMPYVTEELCQHLPSPKDCTRKGSIMISEYPSVVEVGFC